MIRPERFRITPRARRGSGQPLLKQISRFTKRFTKRRGFTLVELLVVITIILALATIAIGVAVPDVQKRRLREASRLINAFLLGASARAAETGRPVAVILEADASQPLMSRTLKYAAVPPPYAGDTLDSRAQITSPAPGVGIVEINDVGWQEGIVRVDDLIRFNYQGHYYVITAVDKVKNQWRIVPAGGTTTVVPDHGLPVPYQVIRQPVASAAADLELPESVVVDLGLSGPESDRFFTSTLLPASVAIVFSPGGSVLSYHIRGNVKPATGPLYLLVGKREHVETGDNLGDFETIWIAINNQSGLITSVENAGNEDGGGIIESRAFARRAQSLGGR